MISRNEFRHFVTGLAIMLVTVLSVQAAGAKSAWRELDTLIKRIDEMGYRLGIKRVAKLKQWVPALLGDTGGAAAQP